MADKENFKSKENKNEETFIKNGKVFDPKKELHGILTGSRETHREKLRRFKEGLARQKEGLGEMEEILIKMIHKNPDASLKDLHKYVEDAAPLWKLTEEQKEIAKDVLAKYEEKRMAVLEYRKKYPDNKMLYEVVFGRKPKGRVEIDDKCIPLYFYLYNIEDFAYANCGNFKTGQKPNKEEVDFSKKCKAALVFEPLEQDLYDSVVIGNASSESWDLIKNKAFDHEEEHFIQRLFSDLKDIKDEIGDVLECKNFMQMLSKADTENEKRLALRRYLSAERKAVDYDIKNEILAYFKVGDYSAEDILEKLTRPKSQGGIYDFLGENHERIQKMFALLSYIMGKKYESLIIDSIEKIFVDEYTEAIENGVESFDEMRDMGYSDDKIIAILQKEPLRKWPKVVVRLMEARKYDDEL